MNDAEIIDVEAEEVKPPRSPWRRALQWLPWLLLLLAAVFAGGVYSTPWLADRLDGRLPWLIAAPGPDFAALQRDLSALSQRVETLSQTAMPRDTGIDIKLSALEQRIDRLAAAPVTAHADPGLADRLAQLENKVAGLNADQGLDETVAMLDARLAALEQDRRAGASHDVAVMALRQLSRSVESGRPYSADLAELRGLLGDGSGIDSAALSVLDGYGQIGVPTLDMLAARFDESAADWLAAAATPADAGAFDRIWARAKAMVSIRRTDMTEGGSPEAVIARAEQRLQARDLDGAVRALEDLPESGQSAARPWIEDAQARLAALSALQQLEDRVFKQNGAAARPAP